MDIDSDKLISRLVAQNTMLNLELIKRDIYIQELEERQAKSNGTKSPRGRAEAITGN